MEITISEEALTKESSRFVVRTDMGYFAAFATMDEAANHADGLAKGYKAAVAKLGTCVGWKRG